MNFDFKELLFFAPMIFIIYFMIFLPRRKEQQATVKMLGALKKGDKVVTHSGMYGEIAGIKDNTITLKFSDSVKIDFTKEAIKMAITEKVEAKV